MRTNGRWRALLVAIVAVAVPFGHWVSNADDGQDKGELTIYDRPTQIGVVAKRVFRDAGGRASKTIYYSPASLSGPYLEESLRVQEIVTSEYDERGRLKREKHYGPDMTLSRIMDMAYLGAKKTIIWRRPDETREYEIREEGDRTVSHLYFDSTGKNLVGMNGTIPSDIDLASWWGQPIDGIACAVGVNRIQGRLSGFHFCVTVLNLTAFPRKVITCLQYHEIQVELRDEAGHLVPQDAERIRQCDQDLIHMNRGINEATQTIAPHQAAQYDGGHGLLEWYNNVPTGTYYLTIRRRADGPDFTLVSKPVRLQVVGEEQQKPQLLNEGT